MVRCCSAKGDASVGQRMRRAWRTNETNPRSHFFRLFTFWLNVTTSRGGGAAVLGSLSTDLTRSWTRLSRGDGNRSLARADPSDSEDLLISVKRSKTAATWWTVWDSTLGHREERIVGREAARERSEAPVSKERACRLGRGARSPSNMQAGSRERVFPLPRQSFPLSWCSFVGELSHCFFRRMFAASALRHFHPHPLPACGPFFFSHSAGVTS